jgi:hypothetical protein
LLLLLLLLLVLVMMMLLSSLLQLHTQLHTYTPTYTHAPLHTPEVNIVALSSRARLSYAERNAREQKKVRAGGSEPAARRGIRLRGMTDPIHGLQLRQFAVPVFGLWGALQTPYTLGFGFSTPRRVVCAMRQHTKCSALGCRAPAVGVG